MANNLLLVYLDGYYAIMPIECKCHCFASVQLAMKSNCYFTSYFV